MKILYHLPSLFTISAGRTIYNGYRNAFLDLGHDFNTLSADSNQAELFMEYRPDIFISSLSGFSLKHLDFKLFKAARNTGMMAFMSTHFWTSPMSIGRVNEPKSLRHEKEKITQIKDNLLGDIFFNSCEQGDLRMDGFEAETGHKHYTILLAADKLTLKGEFADEFKADISFVGTYLPQKRQFLKEQVFTLKKKYNLRLYGQDWSFWDRMCGWVQKGGQYFNLPGLRSLRKPKLKFQDEAKIYKSSLISINVHEDFQRKYGGDFNERTFKIPLCGGFEITDDVACIRKYFKDGEEIVIAKDKDDWFDKIEYFFRYPEKRIPIIEAGKKKVLEKHTYHNRVEQIVDIYKTKR